MPLSRTIYNNYLGEGKMAYGMNIILAIACWTGYNQEDGIVMNYDAICRGMFRTMAFRSYEAYEEDDEKANTKIRFGNPALIGNWKELKPGMDYSKLDSRGIIKEGEYVDETTIIVGAYMLSTVGGTISDASTAPQVWTRGRVEKVFIMVNNMGMRLVKIRVVQDRMPELGDKFSNRHGQKGTIGAMLRGHDMPRTESGIVPDMIMNPHAIPSRMTIAQNLEQLLGKTAALSGGIGDATSFMNDGSPQEEIGGLLEEMGFEKHGNEVLYNGATGEQIQANIFIGPVYGMRLKHMVEDKWNARGKGRKEVRTHQPTGGRGAQGGLKIGEMDRDAIIAHGGMAFVKESFMERADMAKFPICVACGTIPIYNPRLNIAICPLCDGPVKYMGDTIHNLEILPPLGRPKSKIVEVEMPYSTKLLTQEQETYLNLTMRYITTSGVQCLKPLEFSGTSSEVIKELPRLILPETVVPAYIEDIPKAVLTVEQLRTMGAQLQSMTEQEKAVLDTVLDDSPDAQMIAMAQLQNNMPLIQGIDGDEQIDMVATNQLQQGGFLMPTNPQLIGGMTLPNNPQLIGGYMPNNSQILQSGGIPPVMIGAERPVIGPQVPGVGPVIAVNTGEDAMIAEGLGLGPAMGGRQVRRNPFRNFAGPMGGQMGPSQQRYIPMEGGSSSGGNITITKLE